MADTAQEQPVKSLNEELAEALREAEERETEESEDDSEEEEAEEPEEEVDEESEEESDDEDTEDETEDDESDDESEEVEPLEAPQHWAPADQERFKSLPKEAQEFVLDRHRSMEADYTRKTQEIAFIRKRGEVLEEVISPYRQDFSLAGMDDVAAIRQLFAVHDSLKRDPTNTVRWLAQQYGADLTQTDEDVDPQVARLQQQIHQMHQEQQRVQTAQQEQQQQALVNQIKAFEEEKNEGGKLKHPHFITVYDDMTKLLQSGVANSLDDAYTRAVHMRPELQQSLQQEQLEQEKQKQKAEKAKQAKRAKKAASGVKSSGASVKEDTPKSLRDEIGALVDQQLNG